MFYCYAVLEFDPVRLPTTTHVVGPAPSRWYEMHYYYQIIFTNCGTNVKYIARIPKDRGECYEAAVRPVRFASICYEEHVDTDYSLPVRRKH